MVGQAFVMPGMRSIDGRQQAASQRWQFGQ
jgi:hypothetical protein